MDVSTCPCACKFLTIKLRRLQVDTPWPLDIVDVKGRRHMVTIKPGEMIMYEGATRAHGREVPLDGDWFANMFVHFAVPSLYPPPGDAPA